MNKKTNKESAIIYAIQDILNELTPLKNFQFKIVIVNKHGINVSVIVSNEQTKIKLCI